MKVVEKHKKIIIILLDLCVILAIHAVSLMLCFRLTWLKYIDYKYIMSLFISVVYYILALGVLRINNSIWRYAEYREYFMCYVASGTAAVVFFIFDRFIFVNYNKPYYFYVMIFLFSIVSIIGWRIVYRMLRNYYQNKYLGYKNNIKIKRLMIVGAGKSAALLLNEIHSNQSSELLPIVAVDDNDTKKGRTICGIKIDGGRERIPELVTKYMIDIIYIAIPSLNNKQRSEILKYCTELPCKVKTLPYYETVSNDTVMLKNVRDITPEELLGRDPITVAGDEVLRLVADKTIMVTGGGGSIGSELCRQISKHMPKKLIIVDIYENNAYAIQQELIMHYGNLLKLEVLIASVRDYNRINYIMSQKKPDIVIHAAAHKHVPLMEVSPQEAVKNNVFGTYNTAKAAVQNGVKKFILISTDKAVNPTNIMGATKRICEMVVQTMSLQTKITEFAAVRFGNVLGSNGSVIPLFKNQILNGGPITVTHREVIRYFMTIPEAAQLVLTAGAMAKGGEIFVLDMGKPVKIDDLAKRMINMAGLKPGIDIGINYIGLRPGEKLYEELLMGDEGLSHTPNNKIFIGKQIDIDIDWFNKELNELRIVADDPEVTNYQIQLKLKEMVNTFIPKENV